MSYKIGQMRRNQYSSYSNSLDYRLDLILNEDSTIDFYDQCMYLYNENIISPKYGYYLKFKVAQLTDSVQDFVIKLRTDEKTIDNVQEIRTLSVKQGTDETVFELVFSPNENYNQIIFELKRLSLDFHTENEDNKSGRIMKITILAFERISNVISDYLSKHYSGLASLKKIGIQGPPGLMFILDGEEIKIGKSGVYELYNDNIDISYIGFIIKDSSFTQD